jgi:hypothetical protein
VDQGYARAVIRRVAPILALGAVVALVWALPALSHDAGYDTRISIHHPDAGNYNGRVHSDLNGCVRHRTVQFWRPRHGDDEKIGPNFEADRNGRWEFSFAGGTRYYAVAVREVLESPGHRHVCRRDRSPSI